MKATFALLAFALTHCSFGPSAEQKAEAGRISHAVDAIRTAPNDQKQQLFAALSSAACVTPDLCEFKRICSSGYELHLRGLADTVRAKGLLTSGAAPAEVSNALSAASDELRKAEPLIGNCADAQGAAHRKYKF